jgi:LCP family protein required for cell wall assembly
VTEAAPHTGRQGRHAGGLQPGLTTASGWNGTNGSPYGRPTGSWQNQGGAPGGAAPSARYSPDQTAHPYSSGYQAPQPGYQAGYQAPQPGYQAPTTDYRSHTAGYAASPNHSGGYEDTSRRRHTEADHAANGGSERGHRSAQARSPLSETDQRGRHATDWDSGFDRVVAWTLVGGLLPGSGLVVSGRRNLGWLIIGSWSLLFAGAVGLVLFGDPLRFVSTEILTHPERLKSLATTCIVAGVLWAAHLVATNMSLRRFAALTGLQSAMSWALVITLAVGGTGVAVATGNWMKLGSEALDSAFGGDKSALSTKAKKPDIAKTDPWKDTPRINVLLLGSDAGADRKGVRPDTLIVVSINTKTGNATMFSLPRNLEHVPFPEGTPQAADYPDGFYCETHECMINALWMFGEEHKGKYYKGEKNPGLAATVQGVEQTLGLQIDEYAMLNLRGFMQFVDAIGGATINVHRRIPVGGHKDAKTGLEVGVTSYIKPGKRKLNGYQTLWYARSRSDSDDFERMSRQRCVVAALTEQANPTNLALSLSGIMKAARDNISTSIRVSDVDPWVTLALRVQKAKITSLPFTNKVVSSGDPDFDRIHELVDTAITQSDKAAARATASPTAASPAASASPSPTTRKAKPSATKHADPEEAADVKAVC